jgi:hypothetical protein
MILSRVFNIGVIRNWFNSGAERYRSKLKKIKIQLYYGNNKTLPEEFFAFTPGPLPAGLDTDQDNNLFKPVLVTINKLQPVCHRSTTKVVYYLQAI